MCCDFLLTLVAYFRVRINLFIKICYKIAFKNTGVDWSKSQKTRVSRHGGICGSGSRIADTNKKIGWNYS